MTMYYDSRNRENLNKLGDNTKKAALKLYDFAVKNNIEILIYETIRSKAQQEANVKSGASQTMKSYHLVGQALDFVPTKGTTTLWNGYGAANIKKFITEAKRLGFVWGGDWKDFVDKPHLQYEHKGYGTDTFGKSETPKSTPTGTNGLLRNGSTGKAVGQLQQDLKDLGYKLVVDNIFGDDTERVVKQFQKDQKLEVDGIVGPKTEGKIDSALKAKEKKKSTPTVTKKPLKPVGKIRIQGTKSGAAFICDRPSSTSSKNLGTIKEAHSIDILGSVPGWWEVLYEGKRAYINAKYARRI